MTSAEEIKSKLDIVEVIREYIQLKPVGVNFTARCPFHREKTPSFVVSPERQIWRCFGCQKGGDVFSFIMEIEGLSFIEALRQLAPKAGVQLQSYNPQEASVRNRLLDALALAVKYYHKVLLETAEAASAREYLKKRGMQDKTIEEWQIGYSRESWDDLFNWLKNRGFSEQEIFLAGLSVKKDSGVGYYNRFRGRIMFPINDIAGNPVAFTARVSPEREATEKMGKYINSPQTQIYDKSKILFGLDKAKNAIREAEAAIVVEGQMDAISAHQAGFINVVASSGTALSSDQIKLIKRYTNNILFSFDIDAAGVSAANKQIEEGTAQAVVREERLTDGEDSLGKIRKYIYPALSQDINIKVIQVPGGKDPDECIRNNPDDFRQAIERAQSVIDYYFDKTFRDLDLSKIENKKKAAVKLLNAAGNISNAIEKDMWLKRLAETLEVNEQALREVLAKRRKRKTSVQPAVRPPEPPERSRSHLQLLTESLLALALKFPENLSYIISHIKPEMLAEDLHQSFYKNIVVYYNKINNDTSLFQGGDFKSWLQNAIADEQEAARLRFLVDTLLLAADKDFYEIANSEAKAEIGKVVNQIKRKYLVKKMLELERRLTQAEMGLPAQAGASAQPYLEEFKAVADEVRRLDQ